MSKMWQCPRCKAVNSKPDYVLRLSQLSQSLGRLSIGTSGEPAPRCSQCDFEADVNAMLEGEYDTLEEKAPGTLPKPEEKPSAAPLDKPAKTDRLAQIVVGVIAAVLVCGVCALTIGGGIYLSRTSGKEFRSAFLTPTPTPVPPTATPTSVPYLGYRFYLLKVLNPTDEQLINKLWLQPSSAFQDLQLPQGGYILGIERDVTEADLAYVDRSYTSPFGMLLISDAPELAFSMKSREVFENGLFFPSVQSNLVYNGLIRWVWDREISIDLYEGADIGMGASEIKDEAYQDTLIPPLLRLNQYELEVQMAIVEGKAILVRKVFALSKSNLSELQFVMEMYNTEQIFPFSPIPNEVTAAESTSPDLQFEIKKGDIREGLLANFYHTESIWTSFLSCASLDNAPKFLHVKYDLVGWSGPTVKMNIDLTADADAPDGKHYFRIITSCRYDISSLLKERIVEVKISR